MVSEDPCAVDKGRLHDMANHFQVVLTQKLLRTRRTGTTRNIVACRMNAKIRKVDVFCAFALYFAVAHCRAGGPASSMND